MSQAKCTNHPELIAEWPSGNSPEYDLCQECWEAHCAQAFWQMVQKLADGAEGAPL